MHIVHVRLPGDPVDNDRLEVVRSAFRARHPQIPIESTLVAGDAVAGALDSVVPSTALIVMSSDHADREGSASTAEEILRHVGVPALFVGPRADSEHTSLHPSPLPSTVLRQLSVRWEPQPRSPPRSVLEWNWYRSSTRRRSIMWLDCVIRVKTCRRAATCGA